MDPTILTGILASAGASAASFLTNAFGGSSTTSGTTSTTTAASSDAVHFAFALGVMVVITLLLPPQWAVWFPVFVLLAYGANHVSTVDNLLTNFLGKQTN